MITAGVRSADGAMISYHRIGSGPPLVIVPASLETGLDWLPVAELLSADFTLYLMNRRGRGASAPMGADYGLEREYADVAAVLERVGEPSVLLGHSYGGIVALGAALQTRPAELVLYEPPLPVDGPVAGAALTRYEAAIKDGRFDDALEIGLQEIAGAPQEVCDTLRGLPGFWGQAASLAPTWVPELAEIDRLEPGVQRYRSIACPTHLLVGELSPRHPLRAPIEALASVLVDCRTVELAGQAHSANREAPALLAAVLRQLRAEVCVIEPSRLACGSWS